MYKIIFTYRALRDWKKLDKPVKERIASKLRECSEDPFRYARRLTDRRLGEYRLRVGEYRVIFDIRNEEMIILRVGHRKEIYR